MDTPARPLQRPAQDGGQLFQGVEDLVHIDLRLGLFGLWWFLCFWFFLLGRLSLLILRLFLGREQLELYRPVADIQERRAVLIGTPYLYRNQKGRRKKRQQAKENPQYDLSHHDASLPSPAVFTAVSPLPVRSPGYFPPDAAARSLPPPAAEAAPPAFSDGRSAGTPG